MLLCVYVCVCSYLHLQDRSESFSILCNSSNVQGPTEDGRVVIFILDVDYHLCCVRWDTQTVHCVRIKLSTACTTGRRYTENFNYSSYQQDEPPRYCLYMSVMLCKPAPTDHCNTIGNHPHWGAGSIVPVNPMSNPEGTSRLDRRRSCYSAHSGNMQWETPGCTEYVRRLQERKPRCDASHHICVMRPSVWGKVQCQWASCLSHSAPWKLSHLVFIRSKVGSCESRPCEKLHHYVTHTSYLWSAC